MPYAYKLNDIVEKSHKIIALITKIQIKHKHNDNQLSIEGSHFTQLAILYVLFIVRVKIIKHARR